MLESRIEGLLCALAKRAGGDAIKVGVDGWPDRLVVLPPKRPQERARIALVELKRPGGTLDPRQAARLRWLASVGCMAERVETLAQVEEFMARMEAM
jgi:hypothetical protein